jgi:hypothetical protein
MDYARTGVLLLGLALAPALMALEADQVRGTIVSVSPEQNRLELQVAESGDRRRASPGETVEFEISPDTQVRLEDPMESVASPRYLTLEDLEDGAEVVLNFEEIDGRLVARELNTSESSDTGGSQTAGASNSAGESQSDRETDIAQLERESERSQLPATASILPLLALGGAGFAVVAFGIRWLRRR